MRAESWEQFLESAVHPSREYNSAARGVIKQALIGVVEEDKVEEFFSNLNKRQGILLAFKRSLVEDHEFIPDTEGAGVEIPLKVPTGKISLDHLAGFEVAGGEFEDEVLKMLEIAA